MSFRKMGSAARVGLAAALVAASVACVTTPDEPDTATVRFESGVALGACVHSTITLSIDGAQVGSMSAGQSQTFTVSPGSHSLSARAREGTWGPRSTTVSRGQTFAWTLGC